MNRKLMAALAGLLLIPLAGLAAQTAGAGDSFNIISFDIGVAPGYKLGGNNSGYVTIPSFLLNVRVADALSVGFGTYRATTALGGIEILNVKYQVFNKARALIALGIDDGNFFAVGSGGDPVVGLGFEYAPFSKKTGELFTDFKLGIQYFFDPLTRAGAGIENGVLLFGLSIGVGI